MDAVYATTPILFLLLWILIPILGVIFLLRCFWILKKNSEEQVLQNKQMIEILKEIREQMKNH